MLPAQTDFVSFQKIYTWIKYSMFNVYLGSEESSEAVADKRPLYL